MKVGFLGYGHMAKALRAAIPGEVMTSHRSEGNREAKAVAEACDLVFLAVRPQDIAALALDVREALFGKTIVSLAAGRTLAALHADFGEGVRIIRVMPNLCLQVGEGMSAMVAEQGVLPEAVTEVKRILSAAGKVLELEECDFDAVTALSGSGPAYFARFARAAIREGSRQGLSDVAARTLALQTMLGTAKYLLDTDADIDDFLLRIASKGGTTEAGMKAVDEAVFDAAVAPLFAKAAARSAALRES